MHQLGAESESWDLMRVTRGIMIAGAAALAMSQLIAPVAQSAPTVGITWTPGSSLPMGATRWDGERVGDLVYFLGFRAADNSTDGSIWTYDINTQTYADTGLDMPIAISNYTIAALKDANGLGLYTFGGRTAAGETRTQVQGFYPSTGTAQVLASDPWPGMTPAGCVSLPATGVTVYKGKAYVAGGTSFSTSVPACVDDNSAQVWRFDPMAPDGSKWTQRPDLSLARGYLSLATVGKKMYAIGGNVNTAGTLTATTVVEAAKAKSGKFKDAKAADLPIGCDETQSFGFNKGTLAKTITVAGCGQWPTAVPDTLQYDVASDSWATVGALNQARRNHAGANVGSKTAPVLAVFGGYDASSATLATSEFSSTGAPRISRPAAKPLTSVGRVPVL